jgi:hypothetical protein
VTLSLRSDTFSTYSRPTRQPSRKKRWSLFAHSVSVCFLVKSVAPNCERYIPFCSVRDKGSRFFEHNFDCTPFAWV